MRKMLSFSFWITFLLLSSQLPAQQPSNSRVIEGGRLVLDIIKVFKKDKPDKLENTNDAEKETECLPSICFENGSGQKLKVTLEPISAGEGAASLEIHSASDGNDCCYSVSAEIYRYKVEDNSGEILRQAELDFRDCPEMVMKLGGGE